MGRHSSVGIAPRYGLDGSGIETWLGVEIFHTPVQTGPRAHPASYTMGTAPLRGGKQPRRDAYNPLSSSAEVKERVQLYRGLFYGEIYLTYLPLHINGYPEIFQRFYVSLIKFRNELVRPRHLPFKSFSKSVTHGPSYLSDAMQLRTLSISLNKSHIKYHI